MQVEILFNIQFPINIQLLDIEEEISTLKILEDSKKNIRAQFVNSPIGYELRNVISDKAKSDSSLKKALSYMERVLISPYYEIIVTDFNIDNTELPNSKGKVLLDLKNLKSSSWYNIAEKVRNIFNSTVHLFYKQISHPDILSQQIPQFSKNAGDSSYICACLNHWVQSIKLDEGILTNLSFEAHELHMSASLVLTNEKLTKLANDIQKIDITKPKWDTFWQYVFWADESYYKGNIRGAIIDLDMAISSLVKKYLQKVLAMDSSCFNKLTKNSSTGELIQAALLVSNEKEREKIQILKKLHVKRNEIMHLYKRKFNDEDRKIYLEAKSESLKLNDSLTDLI